MPTIEIQASTGGPFLVDEALWNQEHSCEFRDGFLFVGKPSEMTWYIGKARNGRRYVRSAVHRRDKMRIVLLHRLLLDAVASEFIDHKNHDGLKNTRDNIRECTPTQNNWNSRARNGCEFKGVTRRKFGKWEARLPINGRMVSLGHFANREDAARAYDAVREHRSEFALTNFA